MSSLGSWVVGFSAVNAVANTIDGVVALVLPAPVSQPASAKSGSNVLPAYSCLPLRQTLVHARTNTKRRALLRYSMSSNAGEDRDQPQYGPYHDENHVEDAPIISDADLYKSLNQRLAELQIDAKAKRTEVQIRLALETQEVDTYIAQDMKRAYYQAFWKSRNLKPKPDLQAPQQRKLTDGANQDQFAGFCQSLEWAKADQPVVSPSVEVVSATDLKRVYYQQFWLARNLRGARSRRPSSQAPTSTTEADLERSRARDDLLAGLLHSAHAALFGQDTPAQDLKDTPLGLDRKRLLQVERKHARTSMFALMAYGLCGFGPLNLVPVPACFSGLGVPPNLFEALWDPSTIAQAPLLPPCLLGLIIVAITAFEANYTWGTGKQIEASVGKVADSALQKFSGAFQTQVGEVQKFVELAEVKHGRLAMLSLGTLLVQSAVMASGNGALLQQITAAV